MPQAEKEKKSENDRALRLFIERLENWPEDDPPSPAELRSLRREIRLSEGDREKLELLAENHIRRAHKALSGKAYSQAAAELARAAQLKPMDPRPRVELADIYLQRSLERGYGRNDRQRALKLAHKALELNPGDAEAKSFLQNYRRMNASFMAVRYRKFVIPSVLLIGFLSAMIWWQRDWVLTLFSPSSKPGTNTAGFQVENKKSVTDNLSVETTGIDGGGLNTEIISASVGRRNEESFVSLLGRIEVSRNLGQLNLLLKGRDKEGKAVFSIPWSVRDEQDPVLMPGDSTPLLLFRWLAEPETTVESLELVPFEMKNPGADPVLSQKKPEIVWETSRPEGSSLSAEIRDFEILEAFDGQIIKMDLAIENSGAIKISALTLYVSLGSDLPGYTEYAVNRMDPELKKGEKRVWPVVMRIPLDTDISERSVTVTVQDIER